MNAVSNRVNREAGLTLVEVMTTITIMMIIFTLIAVYSPAIRESSRHTRCLANMKQLSLGWVSYQIDHRRRLVGGHTANSWDWVKPGNTDQATKDGKLYPYLNSLELYKCPTDPKPNLRTYSIIGTMNGEAFGAQPIPFFSMIRNPAQQLVFMEEWDYRGSYNNGSWVMFLNNYQWVDYVVPWHKNGDTNNLGFADGHAEQWLWEDPDTLKPLVSAEAASFSAFFLSDPGSADWERMRSVYYNVDR